MNEEEKEIERLTKKIDGALAYWGDEQLHQDLKVLINLCKYPKKDIY